MTKLEQLEAKQARLQKEMQETQKMLKDAKRAQRAEEEKKAREAKIKDALAFYDFCRNNTIRLQDGRTLVLYDYAKSLRVQPVQSAT